ncbi:T9SS type A sorting domain-containing protein [Rhodocytophaga rosea]|uniref:T9SS type A sorting domain-containing protein n=1 Tax=Rhodocytophaga rosea TaxID=2704465 RepID=A0A6C0GSW1_9BACT|nr:T9SS type A sorting domain-containing protein [Rhodocytophaga rosea]
MSLGSWNDLYQNHYPITLTKAGNTLFYTSGNSANGFELMSTTGTAESIVPLGFISVLDTDRVFFADNKGFLFFSVYPNSNSHKGLWKSDGKATGTVPIKENVSAISLLSVNGTVFFASVDPLNRDETAELWKSDGTATGTVLVKDIYRGNASIFGSFLIDVDGTLFFLGYDLQNSALWKSDGTANGTVLVKKFEAGNINDMNLTAVNGTLYFTARTNTNGEELWKSDGTAAGTMMVKDIYPGTNSSVFLPKLINVNNILFFTADDGTHGMELWKSDGTEAGTQLVRDIYQGNSYYSTSNLTAVNGTLYFTSYDGIKNELWKSDGTEAGTLKVLDVVGPAVTCSGTGSILREKWLNVTGYSVSAIPVNTAPSASSQLTSFETTPNQGDNYGERIQGYLCAPYTGNYTFYLAGDDQCELYLSSDEDPTKKTRIASVATYSGNKEWNKFPSQKSAVISLVAGKKYYIEALHKEATGNDHLAVGWQTPAQSAITVIAGSNLSPFIASCSNAAQSSLVVNPSSGGTLSGTSLYLKTIPGASSYTLQVSSSANFTTGVITKTTTSRLSTGTYYASFPELALNQKYFVRVYTNLGLCWGPVTSFTTASAAGSAYVVNPSDGGTTTGTSLYLNTVSGATTYTLQVSTTSDFSSNSITRSTVSRLSTGTYYAVFPELVFNQRYYVRVKTNLSETWGRTTSFTRVNATARLGAEDATESLESNVSLYPNPFEEQLTISSEQAGKRYITIADNLGRVVYQSTTQDPQTELSLAHLKQGVYVVKISTEEGQTQIVKVVKK